MELVKHPGEKEPEKKQIILKILKSQEKDPFIDPDSGDIFYYEKDQKSFSE